MKTQDTIGKLHTETERDAIHIAVCSVVAGEMLLPGMEIGFIGDDPELVTVRTSQPLGIVDPFLKGKVNSGERFWMFLYPNTVTSLRHAWEHPKIDAPVRVSNVPAAPVNDYTQASPQQVAESKAWIAEFGEKWGWAYKEIMDAVDEAGRYETNLVSRGRTLDSGLDFGEGVEEEFWHHVATILGRPITPQQIRNLAWTCSC